MKKNNYITPPICRVYHFLRVEQIAGNHSDRS